MIPHHSSERTFSQGMLNCIKYPVLIQIFSSSPKKDLKKARLVAGLGLSFNDTSTDSSFGNDTGADENR